MAAMAVPSEKDPLETILAEAGKLPSVPEVLLKLDRELKSDDVDLAKVAKLVGMDPVLSGQILRMANSAWYSRGGKPVQELSRGLIRLGLPVTRDLVHALVMPSLFPRGGSSIDLDKFWKHSFAVALFAQSIGRRLKLDREGMEVLWTAGLLHDIGALLFDMVAKENFRRILRMAGQDAFADGEDPTPVDLSALEREWLGADHANMGATFLQKFWKLPDTIVWCVRYHDDLGWALDEPEAVKTILPIHVANRLCDERSVTWVPERARPTGHLGPAWSKMGFSEADADEISAEVEVALEQSEMLLHAAG